MTVPEIEAWVMERAGEIEWEQRIPTGLLGSRPNYFAFTRSGVHGGRLMTPRGWLYVDLSAEYDGPTLHVRMDNTGNIRLSDEAANALDSGIRETLRRREERAQEADIRTIFNAINGVTP